MAGDTKEYLKGYRDGFYAALKIAWAEAENLLIRIPNAGKVYVEEYIEKLKS